MLNFWRGESPYAEGRKQYLFSVVTVCASHGGCPKAHLEAPGTTTISKLETAVAGSLRRAFSLGEKKAPTKVRATQKVSQISYKDYGIFWVKPRKPILAAKLLRVNNTIITKAAHLRGLFYFRPAGIIIDTFRC